jgi:hypothetical protein
VSGEHHIDPNFYNNAQIIVAPSICFDRDQDCLRQIAEGIKKGRHKKGFNRGYKWYKSNYTSKFLLDRGFMKVSTNTIFVVQDGEGKYVVKFVYSPISKNTTDDPLLALSQHIFPLDENVRTLAGQSIVTGRGSKTMFGVMLMLGSWNAYGSACQGLGKGVKQVRVYNPNGKIDEIALRLYQAHADQISRDENRLTPACAEARSRLMTDFDPKAVHRNTNSCMGTAVSLSKSFVVEPHMDSGSPEALEFIKFIKTDGALPKGHECLFVVAGCILELPSEKGAASPRCVSWHSSNLKY